MGLSPSKTTASSQPLQDGCRLSAAALLQLRASFQFVSKLLLHPDSLNARKDENACVNGGQHCKPDGQQQQQARQRLGGIHCSKQCAQACLAAFVCSTQALSTLTSPEPQCVPAFATMRELQVRLSDQAWHRQPSAALAEHLPWWHRPGDSLCQPQPAAAAGRCAGGCHSLSLLVRSSGAAAPRADGGRCGSVAGPQLPAAGCRWAWRL